MALTQEENIRLFRYLSGEMSDGERKSVDQWRREHPSHDLAFKEAQYIWKNSGVRLTDNDVSTDQEWATLKESLEKSDNSRKISISVPLLLKIAASVLIIFIAGYYWYSGKPDEQIFRLSASSQVESFYLPDSTRVWLNSNSTLTYREDFGTAERRVDLQGEGFFEVRRDESNPFVVTANGASVQVLGTSFNLKKEGEDIVLTVAEGVVKFAPADSAAHKGIVVVADERARIGKSGEPGKQKNTDYAYAAWRGKDNPAYSNEKANPGSFIRPEFSWKKNSLNQSVITGSLHSGADLATYANIILVARYTNVKGKQMEARITIDGPLYPGKSLQFEKRLFDIFRDTRKMELVVESADVPD